MGHGTSLVRLKIGNNCTSIPFIVVVKEGRLFLKSVPCTRDLSSFSMSYFEYRGRSRLCECCRQGQREVAGNSMNKVLATRAGSRGPKSASPPKKMKILKIGLKYGKYLYKLKSV